MFKKTVSLLLIFSFLLTFTGVAQAQQQLSQMQVREMQTRVFNTPNTREVFKATINAFQDKGFAITNIEDELGYIRARQDFKARRTDKGRVTSYSFLLAYYAACTAMSFGLTAPYMIDPVMRLKNELQDKTVVIDANANIEKFGNKTKVRVVMIEKILENADGYSFVKSSPRRIIRVYEPLFYQEFFKELDKSIFYEKI